MEDKIVDEAKESLSRRSFLTQAGALTAGMALAGAFLGSLAGSEAEAAITVPISYNKINIDKVRKAGFDAYFEGGCCFGAAKALLVGLREASGVDSAWHKIPEDMFRYGAGGIASWGTLCGALNGAMFVVDLATSSTVDKNKAMNDVGNELLKWYTKFPFPSTRMDKYSAFKKQKTTIAHSPLCHLSVSRWCDASGFTVNSNEKKNRCAKLTGDTAAKAAEMLNKLKSTKVPFKPGAKFAGATNFCMTCHAFGNVNTGTEANAKFGNKDDEQGKMDCLKCHDDEHNHTEMKKDSCSTCH